MNETITNPKVQYFHEIPVQPTQPKPGENRMKRMITGLKVKNFRALYDIEMKVIPPVVALIGPNGSGKTTLLNMFKIINDVLYFGAQDLYRDPRIAPYTYPTVRHENEPTIFEFRRSGKTCKITASYNDGESRFIESGERDKEIGAMRILEDPSCGLYPTDLGKLIESYHKKVENDVQTIFSTYSPTLLNYMEPHEVFYLKKVNGLTEIKCLQDDEKIMENYNDGDSLGYLWKEGLLE